MRRGSLIAPLLLILIGTLFLVKNIRPDLPLFESLVAYWPILLIGWGVLRLLEITVAFFAGKPLPIPGVSGGEWALIILLTIVGSSIWGVQRFTRAPWGNVHIGGWELMGNPYDYPIDTKTVKAGPGAKVVVDNTRGAVRITGASVDEVKVTGRKSVRALDKRDADKAAHLTEVEVLGSGGNITVRGNQDRAGDTYVSVDLEIQVPRGVVLECRGRTGDWDLSDLAGPLDITTDRSSVRVQNVTNAIRINTRHSDLVRVIDAKSDVEIKGAGKDLELENIEGQVTVSGSFSGESSLRKLAKALRFESSVTNFRVEKVPGELQISLSNITGENLVGPLILENSRAKDVRLTDIANSVDITLDRGDIELRQSKLPLSKVNLHTRAGDIELALPEKAQFSLNASTERGNLTNDFSDKLKEDASGRGTRLSGSIGSGPELKASTNSGAVTVRKIGADDKPALSTPEPPPPAPKTGPAAPKAPPTPPAKAENQ